MMKPPLVALIAVVMPVLSGWAQTSAESIAAFRQMLVESAKNDKLPERQREALQLWSRRLGTDAGELSAEGLRAWFGEGGESLPKEIRESAIALAEILERESAKRLVDLEALAREAFEGLIAATDEKPLAELVAKIRAGARMPAVRIHQSSQPVLEKLGAAERLLETWRVVYAARAAGKSLEVVRHLNHAHSQIEGAPVELHRSLREKVQAAALAAGVLPSVDAEKEIRGIILKVISAGAANELDPLLAELRKRQELWNAATAFGAGDSANLAGRAMRFTTLWQDYLAAKGAGATDRARTALSSLTSGDLDVPGVARSMLLERSIAETASSGSAMPSQGPSFTQRNAAFDQLLDSCRTLLDLQMKLTEIESAARRRPGNPMSGDPRILEELRAINRDYQDAKASTKPILPPVRTGGSDSSVVRELRRQLVVFTLSRQFGSPPEPEETPSAYLRRRVHETRDARDWRTMQRLLDAALAAGVRDDLCRPADSEALTHYLAAVNFEEAGVARFAVASYIAALKTGSDFVPLDDIRKRLAGLRTSAVADYDEGLKIAASGDGVRGNSPADPGTANQSIPERSRANSGAPSRPQPR